jgi:hypothetical protein
VAWYENTAGDGSAWTTHTITTSAPFALGVHAADVDGDGDVDVLSTSGNDSTGEWHENVAGNGSVWVAHAIDTAAQLPFSVVATDLDRDGDVDAVAAWLSGRSVWYENTVGNGSAWTMHTVTDLTGNPFFTSAADLDGDGREDVIESQYFDQQLVWYQGLGGQFSLTSTDTAPPTADNSALVSMLRIDAAHLGRAGDRDLELASLGLLFEEAAGDPLTSAEANALVESLRIYRDANGSGVFEPAVDVLVASLADLTLAAGVQTVAFADGDANLQVGVGAPRTYFVVVELTANASQQSPNQLRVTHLGLGPSASSAEDRDFDIVLRPACPADVSSSIRQAVPLELFRFTVE